MTQAHLATTAGHQARANIPPATAGGDRTIADAIETLLQFARSHPDFFNDAEIRAIAAQVETYVVTRLGDE
ncbi:MAG: hypothetical protein K2X45_08020 [Phreatobacter sp.]|nr:hypothetical protein [Phreatobacter sp.]